MNKALIHVYFDDSGFTKEDKLLCLDAVYRELGGSGLKIISACTIKVKKCMN